MAAQWTGNPLLPNERSSKHSFDRGTSVLIEFTAPTYPIQKLRVGLASYNQYQSSNVSLKLDKADSSSAFPTINYKLGGTHNTWEYALDNGLEPGIRYALTITNTTSNSINVAVLHVGSGTNNPDTTFRTGNGVVFNYEPVFEWYGDPEGTFGPTTQRWTGSAWTPADIKRWDGIQWVTATNFEVTH